MCLVVFTSIAQIEISGKIQSNTNEPLSFGHAYLLHQKQGVVSNANGEFKLSINKSQWNHRDTLRVRYVGYKDSLVPIIFNKNKIVVGIKLVPDYNVLSTVNVIGNSSINIDKILKNIKKNIRINYSKSTTVHSGFYNELVTENGAAIILNEAYIDLQYGGYPNNKASRRGFKKYYEGSFEKKSIGNVFKHTIYFPQYVDPKIDKAKIIVKRSSQDFSSFGFLSSPIGGPMDLVALDKVKFKYDFLDPSLRDQYQYSIKGIQKYKETLCYRIEFKPINDNPKVYYRFDKKNRQAIFSGYMLVTKNSFAVVKYEAQIYKNTDFTHYSGNPFLCNIVRMLVQYNLVNGKWNLDKIVTTQVNNKNKNGKIVEYECTRQLNLKINNGGLNNGDFLDEETIPIQRNTSLRNLYMAYDVDKWQRASDSQLYLPISKNHQQDLEQKTSLATQYILSNKTIKELEPPIVAKYCSNAINDKVDRYSWIKNHSGSNLKEYINEENSYYEQVTKRLQLSKNIYLNTYYNLTLHSKVEGNDSSEFEWKFDNNGHWCLFKHFNHEGLMIFDFDQAKSNNKNFNINTIKSNRNGQLAYSYTTGGSISSTLIIKDWSSSLVLDSISRINDFIWLNDSVILYTAIDSSLRSVYLYTHLLNSVSPDKLIYQEMNKTFDLTIEESTSKEYNFLICNSLDESEYFIINNIGTTVSLKPTMPRSLRKKYKINHFSGNAQFIISCSSGDNNTSLLYRTIDTSFTSFDTLYKSGSPILDFFGGSNSVYIKEYITNTVRLIKLDLQERKAVSLKLENGIYSVDINHPSSKPDNVVIEIEGPNIPPREVKLSNNNSTQITLWQDTLNTKVLNGEITSELMWFKSEDGTSIPITLLYKKETIKLKNRSLLLKAYGAYGATVHPFYNLDNLVYINNGFIVAFIHTRGGGELGNQWYSSGKLLNKKNTFIDFVGGTDYLQKKFNIPATRTVAYGSSAGGLIMGYVANMHRNKYELLIFDKPYLDVLSTMGDEKLPLTTEEYMEWGNPSDSNYYNYINSYSPYQNISGTNYPNMLFYIKYQDVQTPYWQSLQSLSKYRESNENTSLILCDIDMDTGHKGSVNYSQLVTEKAEIFAIVKYLTTSNIFNEK
jgi:oligopeptidase B